MCSPEPVGRAWGSGHVSQAVPAVPQVGIPSWPLCVPFVFPRRDGLATTPAPRPLNPHLQDQEQPAAFLQEIFTDFYYLAH